MSSRSKRQLRVIDMSATYLDVPIFQRQRSLEHLTVWYTNFPFPSINIQSSSNYVFVMVFFFRNS